jgi:glycosyltransferase involved in cell wall biosynthesis
MKVMFLSALYAPFMHGGAEKIVQILAEEMHTLGHAAVVVTTSPERGTRVGDVNGVKVYYIGIRNFYWPYDGRKRSALLRFFWHAIDRNNPFMAREIGRIIKAESPDVINSHSLTGLSTAAWRVARRHRVPVVHTLHDYSLLCPKASMYKKGQNCAQQCGVCKAMTVPGRAASKLVGNVIGVSEFTLQRHLKSGYFPEATHRVIYNGIPMLAPQPAAGPASAAPPSGRRLRLGFVGRLAPTKGLETFIDGLLGLDRRDWTLKIAGKGEASYEAELKRRYENAQVQFLGFVDPIALYQDIDLLAVPSLWEEPLATVILEAYRSGVPVLTARRGGLPELVEHERTGLVYDPCSTDGLSAALTGLLDNPALLPGMRVAAAHRAKRYETARLKAEYGTLFESVTEMAHALPDANAE